ncbi:crotonase/enoyl-CoA hydratase family protein [Crossiella cryophila]|uniref:Enoyl-CoA hydratase n=1 Tax=Crossiella cryophila TaxID=43355 RepID=A0A7W7FVM0_9PSEU|nr:crotonase/enoyl-CoA hydratase family protein [Crossiella cryophila]MBB4679190.1 enoyl-CoA hydratase [Crossiella cryophila]
MTVNTETADTVLIITLNRPQARNAINHATGLALSAALDHLESNPALTAGVLHGAGGHFCSGMDLRAFAAGEDIPIVGEYGLAGLTRRPLTKPLLAAVEGYAVAGGFELALSCDLIIAAQSAHFGLPEVKRGLIAGEGGVTRLPQHLPHHIAMELLLTGDPLPAAAAAGYGLVNRVVPDGEALGVALELAGRIGRNAPLALAAVKQIVRPVVERDAFAVQDPWYHKVSASMDAREGAVAFSEKREARWRGC